MSVKSAAAPRNAAAKSSPAAATPDTASTGGVESAAAASKVTETAAAILWDDLPEAEVTTYVRAGSSRQSVEESTPAPVKSRVNEGREKTASAFAANPKALPVNLIQPCGTPERAAAFMSLGRKYATFLGQTMRGKVVSDAELNVLVQNGKLPPATPSGTVVAFSVKPAEQRKRIAKPTL